METKKKKTAKVARCQWGTSDADYLAYHDEEWGMPVTDDCRLFEKLCLEGFQAGLSWLTILRKRPAFRRAFADFNFERVARFNSRSVERLLRDASIIRHRGKIESTIHNARCAVTLRDARGSLASYFWSFEPKRRFCSGKDAGPHPSVDGAQQGPQAAWLYLRGANHSLRIHAGDGIGERSRPWLRVARSLRTCSQNTGRAHLGDDGCEHLLMTLLELST